MDPFKQGYEAFFGLAERPFSLTADPKYYFRSRSHTRALDALSRGLDRRETLLLVIADLGVGKTMLCRTLLALLERKTRVALVGNPLLSPEDFLRLVLQDLGAVTEHDVHDGQLLSASLTDLHRKLDAFLVRLRANLDGAVLIVDEAHRLPSATVQEIVSLVSRESNRENVLQIVLAGQRSVSGGPILPPALEERLATRACLRPLERDECEHYVRHRLTIAGGKDVAFSPPALEVIYGLSGGVPRLVNLLCERAVQEGAAAGSHRIEPNIIESAASALELLRLRPKRFRWYGSNAR